MVRNKKVLLIIAHRVQVLRESVTKSVLGLTDVEKTTSGATDTVDQGLDIHDEDEVLGAGKLEVLEEVEGVGDVPHVGGEFLDLGVKAES
eukprot:g37671.t1